jgi:hypothetical protein
MQRTVAQVVWADAGSEVGQVQVGQLAQGHAHPLFPAEPGQLEVALADDVGPYSLGYAMVAAEYDAAAAATGVREVQGPARAASR